jgi:hypothetical protein
MQLQKDNRRLDFREHSLAFMMAHPRPSGAIIVLQTPKAAEIFWIRF